MYTLIGCIFAFLGLRLRKAVCAKLATLEGGLNTVLPYSFFVNDAPQPQDDCIDVEGKEVVVHEPLQLSVDVTPDTDEEGICV